MEGERWRGERGREREGGGEREGERGGEGTHCINMHSHLYKHAII